MNTNNDQTDALKAILDKYDPQTQKLYMSILKLYTDKATRLTNPAMRNEILELVKEAAK